MTRQLHDTGEEYLIKNDMTAATIDMSLYNDSTDALADGDDLAAITTEPSGTSFSRAAGIAVEAFDDGSDWGVRNSNQVSFDTSDSTQTVDSYFWEISFTSTDTGDTSATEHLIVTGSLSQSHDLSGIDQLDIAAQTAGFTVT